MWQDWFIGPKRTQSLWPRNGVISLLNVSTVTILPDNKSRPRDMNTKIVFLFNCFLLCWSESLGERKVRPAFSEICWNKLAAVSVWSLGCDITLDSGLHITALTARESFIKNGEFNLLDSYDVDSLLCVCATFQCGNQTKWYDLQTTAA